MTIQYSNAILEEKFNLAGKLRVQHNLQTLEVEKQVLK